MFRSMSPLIAVSVALGVILSACGGGSPEVVASPIPPSDLDGERTPTADRVSLRVGAQDLTTVEVVKILTPSVVQVITEIVAMGDFNQPGPGTGIGTGVILDEQGNILTNNHVIADARRISVTLSNGETLAAVLVGGDADTDTAVIRIEAAGLQPAKLGNSSDLQVGEDVIAIGHALGLAGGPTVSKGVVSALGRSIDSGPQTTMVDLIQTDAAINPGNSGGPLMNARAEVIGINTAIIEGSRGIGFAINIDQAKIIVTQLLDRGYVERGGMGIAPFTLTPGLGNQLGVPVTEGVVVARVFPGTAAEEAGLQEQDVVVQMGGERIRNTGELSRFLIAHLPGETVTMVFLRGQEERTTRITLQERPR